MSEREFWALTPRKYWLLLERKQESVKEMEWLAGVIASTVANWSMHAPKEALVPQDFALPMIQTIKRFKPRAPRINRKRVAESMRSIFNSLIERQSKGAKKDG